MVVGKPSSCDRYAAFGSALGGGVGGSGASKGGLLRFLEAAWSFLAFSSFAAILAAFLSAFALFFSDCFL